MPDQTATTTARAPDKQEQPHDDGAWTDELGRREGEVYHDRFGRRHVVTPPKRYTDDGTLVATGAEATAACNAHLDEVQEHNRQALAQLKPHELARFETWMRTRTHAMPPMRPPSTPPRSARVNGRAPREARNDRRRTRCAPSRDPLRSPAPGGSPRPRSVAQHRRPRTTPSQNHPQGGASAPTAGAPFPPSVPHRRGTARALTPTLIVSAASVHAIANGT